MGGQEGNRGYLYQGIASIFNSCLENDWDYISVEHTTENDKVDITLIDEKGIIKKAIQVKSSVNLFGKSEIIKWIKALIDDIDAQKYCLTIIGICDNPANVFIKSIDKFYTSKLDEESSTSIIGCEKMLTENNIEVILLPFDKSNLLRVVRDSMNQFLYSKGYQISYAALEQLTLALISLLMLIGTKGEKICKLDYETKILEWISLTAGNELKKIGTISKLALFAYDIKQRDFQDTFRAYRIPDLPSFISYKEQLLSEGKILIEKIAAIKLSAFNLIIMSYPVVNLNKADFRKLYEPQKAEFPEKEKERRKIQIKKYWNINVEDDFFFVGDLIRKYKTLNEIEFEGTEIQKNKYNFLSELTYCIFVLECIDILSNSMEDVLVLPLCIKNIGCIVDKNITITIPSETEDYNLYKVNKDAFGDNKDILNAIADTLVDEKILEAIFKVQPNEDVNIEESQIGYYKPLSLQYPFNRRTEYDLDDLINEMSLYQAQINSSGNISCTISNLRPSESKWLATYMMVVSKKTDFKINYTILSENSGDKQKGELSVLISPKA